MGSKSSSSSSSQQYDNRTAASGGGIAAGPNSRLSIRTDTPEAWEFGGEALDFTEDTFSDVVNLASEIVGGSFEVVKQSDAKVSEALDFARQTQQSEAGNNLETLVKVALPIAAGAYVVSRFAK